MFDRLLKAHSPTNRTVTSGLYNNNNDNNNNNNNDNNNNDNNNNLK